MTRAFALLAASFFTVGSSIASETARPQYETNLGTITLQVPKGYVPLSQVDRARFDASLVKLDEPMPTIEILMSTDDWQATREQYVQARDELVYLSLLPNAAAATDESWSKLRRMLLSAVENGQVDEQAERAELPASRFIEADNADHLKNLVAGRAYAITTDANEVRWVVRQNMEFRRDDSATQPVLFTYAWIRKGQQVLMLRSSKRLARENDALDSGKRFSAFVSAIRFDARVY